MIEAIRMKNGKQDEIAGVSLSKFWLENIQERTRCHISTSHSLVID